ncbi:MAG: hypothetical protein A3H95_04145 [Acidobacteria bacterium RIFCSPLOWO2_02_FULL_64_15]|nr:MAG: hypothetical protein A3H95_04145 [Acidobacteria bacterium RIFCSPLOWO2_02_FULL_64_15]
MPRPLAARVAVLESQMQSLQELPGQVAALDTRVASLESQFLQFRAEVKDEFLTTRREITAEIRGEIRGEIGGLREEMRAGDAAVGGEVNDLRRELGAVAAGLREEIRTGLEDTRRYMRMLHEQVRADIKTIRDK